jgi:hypothetical protein
MFTEIGVQNRSDRVTYLGNVHFVKRLPQTLQDHPCCPAIQTGLDKNTYSQGIGPPWTTSSLRSLTVELCPHTITEEILSTTINYNHIAA